MESSKAIIVTGGAGFIGSELVRQLLDSHTVPVVVYDNFSFGNRVNLPREAANVFVEEGDLRDQTRLQQVFEKYSPGSVFHLAAIHYIPYCISHPQEAIQVNVEGTLNVLEQCGNSKVDSLVYASTMAVYPVSSDPHRERDSAQPIEIYGMTKYFGERLVSAFHHDTGMRCAVARLSNAFGRRETNAHVIPDILDQLRNGNEIRLGNIEPKRDFIHTSDIARALRLMASTNDFGLETFNLGTGVSISVSEVVKIIAELLGKPLKIVVEESRKRKVERMNLVPDITKIRNRLHWRPEMSLKDGFADLLTWSGLL